MIVKRLSPHIIALTIVLFISTAAAGQMTVHHINVGQGDATLLEFRTAAVLVDAGGSRGKVFKKRLFDYLDRFFKERKYLKETLYAVVITHPHQDHTINAVDLIEKYRVWNFVDNGDSRGGSNNGTVETLQEIREEIKKKNAQHPGFMRYHSVASSDIGPNGLIPDWAAALSNQERDIDIRILNASRNCSNRNNDSLIIRAKYGNSSILITGDAQYDAGGSGCIPAIPRMLDMFRNNDLLDVDIYKVGHHGARNGTNTDFLNKLKPKISIVSAGHADSHDAKGHGHPNAGILELLNSSTTLPGPVRTVLAFEGQNSPKKVNLTNAVYCTCWDGNIVITRVGGEIAVNRNQ